MNPRFLATTFVAMSLLSTAFARPTSIQEGKPLPIISATAATGKWLERAPLDPASYGKTRGVSPATFSEPKIVLYTSVLNEDFFKIAVAIDKSIARHPELAWSFVQVTDTKGAQYGGYTADELRTRLNEVQKMAKKHGIQHLSFLIAAPGSHTTTPETTVVIAHVVPPVPTKRLPIVDWVTEMPAASLQGDTLSRHLSALEAKIATP